MYWPVPSVGPMIALGALSAADRRSRVQDVGAATAGTADALGAAAIGNDDDGDSPANTPPAIETPGTATAVTTAAPVYPTPRRTRRRRAVEIARSILTVEGVAGSSSSDRSRSISDDMICS